MKGDIKISKNSALILAGALSLFAMADFVSLVDTESAGGIIIEKETMDVGSVVLRMDEKNPSTIYGGTWELITGDATLTFGDGSRQSGNPIGNNTPLVPIVEHSHSMEHDHPLVLTSSDSHNHTFTISNDGTGGNNLSYPAATEGTKTGTRTGSTNTDSHNHNVDLPNYVGNTGLTGVSNATIDVRGSRIAINVWKRIS